MKKLLVLLIIAIMSFSFVPAYAAGKQTAAEIIKKAEAMKADIKGKVNFLIGQANAFYNSKEYQKAIDVANYVLQNLDNNSQKAKDLLEKAKQQLAAKAQGALDNAKKKFGLPAK